MLIRLILLILCAWPTFASAQQEMRSSTKGASTPLPITGSVIDADHNALDVKCLSGCSGGGGAGDASLAEQQTQTGLLTTIDGDTGTISTNSSTLAGAVKAEDAAHSTGDTGIMSLCVRTDTAAARATTDGDYNPCATDASGRLWSNTELPDAATLADDTANPSVPGVAAFNMCYDGSTWDRCPTAAGGAGTTTAATSRVVVAYDSGVCNAKDTLQVAVAVSSSGNNELVALASGQTIYICDLTLIADGTVGVQLIYGTGTACATGETNMSGVLSLVANSGWTHDYAGRLKTAAANAFCLELSGAVAVNGILTYRQAATF